MDLFDLDPEELERRKRLERAGWKPVLGRSRRESGWWQRGEQVVPMDEALLVCEREEKANDEA